MPATIPSHQALVLPLKLLRPRRFDGVALGVGSAIPDLAYVAQGLTVEIPSHAWHSLLWFSLPLTLVACALVRRAASTVAIHLPDNTPLSLRDYGVLSSVRHPLAVTAASAVLGAASHLLWDTFTHPYVLIGHPFTGEGTFIPAMHRIAVAGLPWWRVVHLASEAVGTLAVLAMAVHIGRKRLLRAWHGPAPVLPRRPALFWSAAATVLALTTTVILLLPGNDVGPNVIGMRLITAVALSLLAAAAVVAVAAKVSAAARDRLESDMEL